MAHELSAVVALANKASDLRNAGHLARSYEYEERALAAAQALGAQDCLIVAQLQLNQANKLFETELLKHRTERTQGAVPLALVLPPFFAAVATVQRRRAAGTLLTGACRATEESWFRLMYQEDAAFPQNSELRQDIADIAPLVGYLTFLDVSAFAVCIVLMAHAGVLSVTAEQLRECVALMADAAELMVQPRIHEHICVPEEGAFSERMQTVVTRPNAMASCGADRARLFDSWQRLVQSGVLQRRHVDAAIQASTRQCDSLAGAVAAAAAAPGLRSCALASCCAREAHPAHFKSCAACRGPVYCCKEHQTEDWPNHKAACKAARKAAAEQPAL